MKKVLFVVALCTAVVFANAQEKTAAPTNKGAKATTEQTVQKPVVVKEAELLKPIKENIAKDFAGYTFVKASKLDTKGVVTYEVVVKKEKDELTLTYDKDGKFVKKEAVKPVTKPEPKTTAKPATPPTK